jgi:hypothetical protein
MAKKKARRGTGSKGPTNLRKQVEGFQLGRVNPRLRMFADGDTEVNTIRAQFVSSIGLTDEAAKKPALVQVRNFQAARARKVAPKLGKLKKLAPEIQASVFVTQVSQLAKVDDPVTGGREGLETPPGGATTRPARLGQGQARRSRQAREARRSGLDRARGRAARSAAALVPWKGRGAEAEGA